MRRYHHLGIPIQETKKGERYHANLKFSSTPFGASEYRVQWHRFDKDCPLPEIVKTVPHVAFVVDDLEKEIAGKKVIFGPYEPLKGYRVAMIETEQGFPVELIETKLTDEELIALEEIEEINDTGINIRQ
jgi:hypothetical protein